MKIAAEEGYMNGAYLKESVHSKTNNVKKKKSRMKFSK